MRQQRRASGPSPAQNWLAQPRLGRRQAVLAGGWSVPILAVAAAAPAFAVSPVACPAFPTAGYTETTTGTLNSAPRGFTGTTYRMNTDANSLQSASVTTTSPAIAVTIGTTYTVSILIQTQYGVNNDGNGPAGTRNTNVTVSVLGSLSGTVSSGPYSTQTGGGGVVVTPINGGWSTGTTVTLSFTATMTGTVQVRYAFVMAATIRGNDDDYQITTSFLSCVR